MQPTLVPTRAAQVDEFYLLDQQVKAFAPKAKRHTELATAIRSWYEDHPADQSAIAEGACSSILVGERSEERSLSLKAKLKIYSLIGRANFIPLVNLTLKAAIAATNQETVDKLATKERSGSRKLVAIAKTPETKAA